MRTSNPPTPSNYAEERDQRWIEASSVYVPRTEFGQEYKAWFYPNLGTKSVNTRTNPTLTVYEP